MEELEGLCQALGDCSPNRSNSQARLSANRGGLYSITAPNGCTTSSALATSEHPPDSGMVLSLYTPAAGRTSLPIDINVDSAYTSS